MKNFFACLAVIIGTVIGAGFASGREILNFFNIYEERGLVSILISSMIFGIVVVITSLVVRKSKSTDYKNLINSNGFLFVILQMFSFICFAIMISGVGAFFYEHLSINFWLGTAIAASICYAMFLNSFKGIEIISCILVPLIIIGIVILGTYGYDGTEILQYTKANIETANYTGNFIISAILYASYNSLILVPILVNFEEYKLSHSKILYLGIATTLVLGILMFLIYKVNNIFYPNIMAYEIPNMLIASFISKKMRFFYGIVILAAIFTTAFSSGFSFLKMRSEKNYERNALVMCIAGFLCARIGFSNLINICFPIFGYVGIYQIILILMKMKDGECGK